jgi:divalent metal cation (Fe/Co/Zn/Cd) transporter
VDMRIIVDAGYAFVEAHGIVSQAEQRISALIPGADVVIHADPSGDALAQDDPRQQLSTLLDAHRGMFRGYHDLSTVRHGDSYLVNMHLEMESDAHLSEVHKVCDHLERDIKQRLPGAQVTIHVEPSRKRKRR